MCNRSPAILYTLRCCCLLSVISASGCKVQYEHHNLKRTSPKISTEYLDIFPSFYPVTSKGPKTLPPWKLNVVIDGPPSIEKVVFESIVIRNGDLVLGIVEKDPAVFHAKKAKGGNFYVNHAFPTLVPKTIVHDDTLTVEMSGTVWLKEEEKEEFKVQADFRYEIKKGEDRHNPLLDVT